MQKCSEILHQFLHSTTIEIKNRTIELPGSVELHVTEFCVPFCNKGRLCTR